MRATLRRIERLGARARMSAATAPSVTSSLSRLNSSVLVSKGAQTSALCVTTCSTRAFSTNVPISQLSSEEKQNLINNILQKWSHLNKEGTALMSAGLPSDLEQAESFFRQAMNAVAILKSSPYRLISMSNLGSCLLRRNRPADAVHLFRSILMDVTALQRLSNEQVASIYTELASALEANGDVPAAVQELHHAKGRFVAACERFVTMVTHPTATGSGSVPDDAQRMKLVENAIASWRGATSCEFRASVTIHKQGDWEGAANHLNSVITDLTYFVNSLVALSHPSNPTSPDDLPTPPPSSPSITIPLLTLVAELPQTKILDYVQNVTSDLVEAHQSLGATLLDLERYEQACDAYVQACELVLNNHFSRFLEILSDASKSLRIAYERLEELSSSLAEQQDGAAAAKAATSSSANKFSATAAANAVRTSQLSRQRAEVLKGLESFDKTRARMRLLFNEYTTRQAKIHEDNKRKLKDGKMSAEMEAFFSEMKAELHGFKPSVTGQLKEELGKNKNGTADKRK